MAEVTKVRSVGHTFRTRYPNNDGALHMYNIMAARMEDPEYIGSDTSGTEPGIELYRFSDGREAIVRPWKDGYYSNVVVDYDDGDEGFEVLRWRCTGEVRVEEKGCDSSGLVQVSPVNWVPVMPKGETGFYDDVRAEIQNAEGTVAVLKVQLKNRKTDLPKRVDASEVFWFYKKDGRRVPLIVVSE